MSYEKAIASSSTTEKVIRTRVLIVDDDTTCLTIVAALLKLFNYGVTTINCPLVALSILRKSPGTFNLVLSDVHMPLMNGLDLQKIVEEDFHIPVVLMSADNNRDIMMESLKNGASFYIVKPPKLEDVSNLWQHAIPKNQSKANDSFRREVETCNGVIATDAGTSNCMVATEVTTFNDISTIDLETGNAQVAVEALVATEAGISEGQVLAEVGTSSGQVTTDVEASNDMEATTVANCNDTIVIGGGVSNILVTTDSLQGVQINALSVSNSLHLEDREQPTANIDGNSAPSKPKKRKMTWTDELHDKFLKAIEHLGIGKAVPKKILEFMNVPGLTRENIASHLQKYRIYTKRVNDSNGATRPLKWSQKPFRSSFSWGQFPTIANNSFILNYSHAPNRNLHPPPRPVPTNYGQLGDNKSLVKPPYVGSQGLSLNHSQSNTFFGKNTSFQQNNQIQPTMNAYCVKPTNVESNYNLHRMTNLEGPLFDRQSIVSDANQGDDLARAALQFLHPKPNLGYFNHVDNNNNNHDGHLMTSCAQKNMQFLQPHTPFEMNNNVNPFIISSDISPEYNHMSHGGSLVANGLFENNHQENRLFHSNQRFNAINNGLMDPYQVGNGMSYSHGMVGNAQEHVKLSDHNVIQGQLMEQGMNMHSNLNNNVFSGDMGIANFGTPINQQVQMPWIPTTDEPVIMPNLSNISPTDQPLNIPFMNDMLANGQRVGSSKMNTTSINGRSLSMSNMSNVSVNPQVDISNTANLSTNGQSSNVISNLDTIYSNAPPVMPSTDHEPADGNPIIAVNGETMSTTNPPAIPSNMDDVFGTDMSMFISNTNVPIIVGGGAETDISSLNNHGKETSTFGFTSTSPVHVHDWTSNQFNDFSMDYGMDDFSTIFPSIDSHDGNNNT